VPDLTSVEDFLTQAITPGMTDEQKCMAVWQMVYYMHFWNPSSRGCIRDELGGTDPILNVHCFAPTICQEDAEIAIAYWGLLGYSTRMWQLGWHTSPEVYYGGKWRHFDPTLGVITRNAQGEVDSITTRTDYWRPQQYGNAYPWMGPSAYVSNTEPYVLGHTMGLMLRQGESLTRYWYPLSTDPEYYSPGNNGARPSDRGPTDGYPVTYLQMAMDLTERRFDILPYSAAYANGVWTFQPDLGQAGWQDLFEKAQNATVSTAPDGRPSLHPAAAGQASQAVIRIVSPYILTGGWIDADLHCDSSQDSISVYLSADCGNTWQLRHTRNTAGTEQVSLPLAQSVNSKFECLVRFDMQAAGQATGARISGLSFQVIQQNSPFPLPALKLGDNAVRVAAGEQLDRLTIIPPLDDPKYRNYIIQEQNIVTAREGGQSSWVTGICARTAGQQSFLVFRVDTPGDMQRLRCGGQFADDNTNNKMYYSFNGADWIEMPWTYSQAVRNTQNSDRTGVADYETLNPLPAGTRTVWIKFWFYRGSGMSGYQLQLMTGLSIDAHYTPVSQAGDLPPVDVTYCWAEFAGGQEHVRTDTHTVPSYPDTYNITVLGDSEPVMKWVKVSRANPAPAWPVVDAGDDQVLVLPDDTASLHGAVSDDGLPDPPGTVTILWSASGPGAVQFGSPSQPDTTATFSEPGVYVLRLTADDGQYQSWDELTVTVAYADTTSDMVAWYPFETGAEDVAGANDGTMVNGATVVANGQRGNVLSLDGTNDYVDLPMNNLASGASELTLAMWIRPDEWVSTNTIYDEYGGGGQYWQFSILEGKWYTRDASTGPTGSRDNDLSLPAVPLGQWHHLAFVYSVSRSTKAIYLDGVLAASTSTSVDTLTTSRNGARIGYPCDGNYFDGLIDDVLFYRRALSTEEIGLLAGRLHRLTVHSGGGDGLYEAGQVVDVAADPAPSGREFACWTGDTAALADPQAADTTLTMPAADVEVTATYSAVVPPLPGDLNGDGFVGQGDLNIVLAQWGKGAPPHEPITDPRADANHDNFVGQSDLNMVLADWGKRAP